MFTFLKKTFVLRNLPKELRADTEYMKELNAEAEALGRESVNLLEAALIHLQIERTERALRVFTDRLVLSNIRVISNSTAPEGMLIIDAHGSPNVAVYTDNTRANRTRERFPDYKCLLTLEFANLVQFMPRSLGMVVNPLWRVAHLYMKPEMLEALRRVPASNPCKAL